MTKLLNNKYLIIERARQNNLKNISLKLPHDNFIVITGPSGSGKSSLAFDTIFAEGQWRFIESLSTYARMFLEKIPRPDVDVIKNIRPAIALEQKNPIKGSRSTVGTLTEIYDLLRVLYTKIAKPYCPKCGKEIIKWTIDKIVSVILKEYLYKKIAITFYTNNSAEALLKEGFYRIFKEGQFIELTPQTKGPFEIVVDRLVVKDTSRLNESLQLAWNMGKNKLNLLIFENSKIKKFSFSSENVCDECGIQIPEPCLHLFSFNNPVGACHKCKGFGNILKYDESLIVPDSSLSLKKGAVEPWETPAASWWKQQMLKKAQELGIDIDKPFCELSKEEKEIIFYGTDGLYGVYDFFEELQRKKYKLHVRVFLSRYRSEEVCPLCNGKRLKTEALSYKIFNKDIIELGEISIRELIIFFKNSNFPEIASEVVKQIKMKLLFLKKVGVDYLTLNRLGKTLSGGEYQRVNLANQIASWLKSTLYVLDEPTVGLHPRDTEMIIDIIKEMASAGNTMIVVEHDSQVIKSANWIVELGPEGGSKGGKIIFSGKLNEFLNKDTLTSRYIKGENKQVLISLKNKKSLPNKFLLLKGATGNNLKNVDLMIPIERFTVVTGVSGSGKSSLIIETLYKALARILKISTEKPLPYKEIDGLKYIKSIKLINQSPIGKTPRSNPVTYLKIFEQIRKLFSEQPYAKQQGYGPGFFSFNIKGGRCEKCKGEGFEKLEMYFFEDLYVTCEECKGKRYKEEALKVVYKGKNIHDILEMTVDEAVEFFSEEKYIKNKLSIMQEIALGYLKLGQPATTLSGGEAQRLKICAEMSINKKTGIIYILDEPTVGLHFKEIVALLKMLKKLVQNGNTVVVIEHNLDLISVADWIVDLGPEGGPQGGNIIYQGPIEKIVYCKNSITGKFLSSFK